MKGVYQYRAEKHLDRYLAEFGFRYSNRVALGVEDQDRAEKALTSVLGERLTYRAADKKRAALLKVESGQGVSNLLIRQQESRI
jgi:hypothetical protein